MHRNTQITSKPNLSYKPSFTETAEQTGTVLGPTRDDVHTCGNSFNTFIIAIKIKFITIFIATSSTSSSMLRVTVEWMFWRTKRDQGAKRFRLRPNLSFCPQEKYSLIALPFVSDRKETKHVLAFVFLVNIMWGKPLFLSDKSVTENLILWSSVCLWIAFVIYTLFPKVGVLIVFTCLMADYQVISIMAWGSMIVLSELSVMSLCVTLACVDDRPMALFLFLSQH